LLWLFWIWVSWGIYETWAASKCDPPDLNLPSS
jgi:hypothetical protein